MTAATSSPRILLAAGGTGGHLFPAEALARELLTRGLQVDLVTDARGQGFGDKLPQVGVHRIAAGGVAGKGIGDRLRNIVRLGAGYLQSRRLVKELRPAVAVGFGGYPSVPPLLAAQHAGVKTVLHEQNAVAGRANRFLLKHASRVATSFDRVKFLDQVAASHRAVTGNPVRPEIRALADLPYTPPTPDGPIRLLITGGSQGAKLLSELVPQAIAQLPEPIRMALMVQQQSRPESLEVARRTYRDALIEAEIAPFFRDMANRLGQAHLVIGRAGASTCCELAVAGRPSILVPLKIAADDHQTFNAKLLSDVGAATVIVEDQMSVESVGAALQSLLGDAAKLAAMSTAAKSVAQPDAAEKLADLVERTARA